MKLLHDWVKISFYDDETTDSGLYAPKHMGDMKKANVEGIGPDVENVEEGDTIFVKNFKPLGRFNGEDLVLTREGNIQCKVVE